MRSMTGFGRGQAEEDGISVDATVRTVNHRFIKIQTRLDECLFGLEPEIDRIVRRLVRRGSVTVGIRIVRCKRAPEARLDLVEARHLFEEARALARDLDVEDGPNLDTILTLPGVVVTQTSADELGETETTLVKRALEEALGDVIAMREREGAGLRTELAEIRARCAAAVARIRARAPQVVREYTEKLTRRLNQLLRDHADQVAVNDADVLREVAIFADRCDVSEELQRLSSHLDQFDGLLDSDGEIGRKLDFLIQEMLREANTIASKASDGEIAQIVVDVKTDIERLREQVQNVE